MLKADNSTIHMVVVAFNEIKRSFQEHLKSSQITTSNSDAILLKLEKRPEETLTATHFAAYLLGPEQKGAYLTENLLAVEYVKWAIFFISKYL